MFFFIQAAELAEFTAKIALLEEAKRKKEEEASEWQHKVIKHVFSWDYFGGSLGLPLTIVQISLIVFTMLHNQS